MKVLLVSPNPDSTGGIARWTRNVLVGLERECLPLELILLSTTRKRFIHPQMFVLKRIFLGIIFNSNLLFKYHRIIRSNRIEVLHINTSGKFAFIRDLLLLRLARYYNIKTIVHMHFGRIPELFEAGFSLERLLAKEVVFKSDGVIVLDQKTEKCLSEFAPRTSAIYLLPNFVDDKILNVLSEKVKVWDLIFAGQLLISKVLREFLASLEAIKKPLDICICGKENMETRTLVAKAIAKNSIHNIRFFGEVNHVRTIELIRESRALVLPSYTEGFPNVIIEAMAQKTIVIATGVGAIPEILNFAGDRPLGLEIILRSSQSISRQVDFILNESEEFYNDMTLRSFREVESKYTTQVVCSNLYSLWYEIFTN